MGQRSTRDDESIACNFQGVWADAARDDIFLLAFLLPSPQIAPTNDQRTKELDLIEELKSHQALLKEMNVGLCE